MAAQDTKEFLEDLLIRYDPTVDLSDGSRAQTDLIGPILSRLGPDPFDEDITVFVRSRVQQVYPDLAITEADALTDTLIDPMRTLIEPIVREIKLVKLRSSLRNVESMSDDEVDALMANFFESRQAGGYARGQVRIYFAQPQSASITLTNPASTRRSGLRFFPTRPQQITADQMLLNVDGSEYYFDVNYTAENRGSEYNVEAGDIVAVANLPSATRATNLRRFRDGVVRETSLEYVGRVEGNRSDRTLTTSPGIASVLGDAFPAVQNLFVVGFRDPEMMRDVVKGGSLGPIRSSDDLGDAYGLGKPADDLDGDLTTPILEAAGGHFVSRVGSAGSTPSGWFITLVYLSGGAVVAVDAGIVSVVSDDRVRTDHEMPTSLAADSVTWMLRRRQLTVSDIPGGIVLPDTPTGELEVTGDAVHIGGKTDIYVAGETESSSAQITGLSDESPLARGANGQTDAAVTTVASADIVLINDTDFFTADVEPGMSLVFDEGADAGSYRILEVVVARTSSADPPAQLRLDTLMTGTQANLSWRLVDEIDVELTDPKEIKATGDDLVTASGSRSVTTTSSFNFLDANVQKGDILEITDDVIGGDYTIAEVTATGLVVDPAPERTVGAAAFRVFRRSEAVDPPLVRVSSLELLDSGGAPVGTTIPYRNPVLAESRAFQNEGAELVFDGVARIGLVSTGFPSSVAVGSLSITWEVYDPDEIWAGAVASGTFIFDGNVAVSGQVTNLNANTALSNAGVRATELNYGGLSYIGIVSAKHVRFTGGTALATLGIYAGQSNATVSGLDESFTVLKVRTGDMVEIAEGNSAGLRGRVVAEPEAATNDAALVGTGPIGPAGTTGAYNNVVFSPDVGARVRIGRPSVGSARVYFLAPTCAEFRYASTRFTASNGNIYTPDPENRRTLMPAVPLTTLPKEGVTALGSPTTLTDSTVNFLKQGIRAGDILEVLYRPVDGTGALAASGNIAVGGATLILRLDSDPFIQVAFPFHMPRQDVVDYINDQVGEDIATITGSGVLRLQPKSRRLEISEDSTVLSGSNVLYLSGAHRTNEHPDKGEYIISDVSTSALEIAAVKALTTAQSDTQYRIKRYLQRVSSSEMNDNLDASGLYYADIELLSTAPGNQYNIEQGVSLVVTGHYADGYELRTESEVTSYSRAEVLHARMSRTILLVGSSDSPEEYVQLSQQNVQVNYDRSELVDEVQSFVDSDAQRSVCSEALVRHLLPHYVSLGWSYVGGSTEAAMTQAISDALEAVAPGEELEVDDITGILRHRGATSVFTPDSRSSTGRRSPLLIVVYHDEARTVRGVIVDDVVDTVRTQRFIPENIGLKRISTGGIR